MYKWPDITTWPIQATQGTQYSTIGFQNLEKKYKISFSVSSFGPSFILFFKIINWQKNCLKFILYCCSIWDAFLSIENYGKTKESKDNIQSGIFYSLFLVKNYFWQVQSYGYVWNTLHSYYKIHKCFYIPLVSRRLEDWRNKAMGHRRSPPCCMFTTVIVVICRQTPAQVWGVRRK